MFIKVTRLKEDEIQPYLIRLRSGDQEAKHRFTESYIPLTLNLLRRRECKDVEVVSEALFGLAEAIEALAKHPEPHQNPGGFITVWVTGRLHRYYFKNRRRIIPYRVSKQPFNNRMEVQEILEKFTPKQRFVIDCKMANKTDVEVAAELGCTKQNVSLIRKEIQDVYRRLVR